MQYQDQNNEIIFTQEFFIEAGGGKTYFDPDDNELAAELQTPYQSKIDDCVVVRREQGIYDVKVFFPKNQSGVILYLTWLQEGLRKAIGYNINTVYASGKFEITPQNIGDLQLSQHMHDNYEVLQGFTDVDGVLHYKGIPIGGDITGIIINDAEISSNETWSSEKISQELNNIELTPGADGQDGVDGDSAYQIWLSLGNSGTEQDFIDSLQGEQGLPGVNGQDGAPGPNQVTTDTDTNITGVIKGAAGKVAQATAGTDYLAPNGNGSQLTGITASQVGAHATGADIDAGGHKLKNFDADVLTDSNTSITLSATHRGKILHTTSASAVTVTIPDTCESGFTCTVRQEGAGQITFAAGSNMTLRNRQSHTKSAGQYSGVCVSVEGTGYVYIQGDTAA